MERKNEHNSQTDPKRDDVAEGVTAGHAGSHDGPNDPESSIHASHLAEKRRSQRALYIVSALSVVQLVGLILFFFFFIDSAGQSLDEKLDARIDRLCNELQAEVLDRVSVAGDLKAEMIRLRTRNEELQAEAADARETLRRQLIVMDREKRELKNKERLLDDSIAYLEEEKPETDSSEKENEARAEENKDKDDDTADKEEIKSDAPAESLTEAGSDLLYDLNHFLSGYSDSALKIIEFKKHEDSSLHKPVVRAKQFLNQGSAVLMPETLTFQVEKSQVHVKAMGGIAHLQTGETRPILDTGVLLASLPMIEEESSLSKQLCRLFGIEPLLEEIESAGDEMAKVADTPFLLVERLNELLKKERGEKYQFKSIGRIQEKQLKNVKMQQHGEVASLNHLIVADSCELWLVEKHRYLEIRFKDGFLIKDNKSHPFYDNQYRLPIPEVDCNLWIDAKLDCLNVEKTEE